MAISHHALFVACSEAADDRWLADIFLGFAYGVFPFAVREDAMGEHLFFQRTGDAAEAKDKALRLKLAADHLNGIPEVQEYNKKNNPLFINGASLSVAWPLGTSHSVDTHVRIIPCLLRWTRMDRFDGLDGPWGKLYRQLSTTPSTRIVSRTVKTVHILDYVGNRAQEEGLPVEKCLQRVREALDALNMGHLTVESLPDGTITEVRVEDRRVDRRCD